MSADEFLLHLALPSRPQSAALVPRALARELPAYRMDDDGLADLQLPATVLITNAIRHGRPGPSPSRSFAPRHTSGSRSPTPAAPSRRPPPNAGVDGGLGLPLIQLLSSRWGIEPAADAVTVRIEYTNPSAQAPAQ